MAVRCNKCRKEAGCLFERLLSAILSLFHCIYSCIECILIVYPFFFSVVNSRPCASDCLLLLTTLIRITHSRSVAQILHRTQSNYRVCQRPPNYRDQQTTETSKLLQTDTIVYSTVQSALQSTVHCVGATELAN